VPYPAKPPHYEVGRWRMLGSNTSDGHVRLLPEPLAVCIVWRGPALGRRAGRRAGN